jgi:hypothetical protein
MSTIRFTGNAETEAQVDTFTPANVEVGDIFTLTVTGLDGTTAVINFTATAATVANVTAGLTAAWNASTNALCTPITAADGTTELTLTADTAGVAFSVAASTTNGGAVDDQTLTRAATNKNEGPSDWSSVDNWSGGALPGGGAGEEVYVEGATILYGLDQSGIANTLTSLNIKESQIGTNPADGYLAFYLQIKATAVSIGHHSGPGTTTEQTPVNIDTGSVSSTVTVYKTGTNSDSTMPAVRLKANNPGTVIRVRKGIVGVAYEDGETTGVSTIAVSYDKNRTADADVFIGAGVTVTTVEQIGGDIVLGCGATTVNAEAGTLTTEGDGAITTLNAKGATVYPNSTGTITTLPITGGTVDFTRSMAARTVTTLKLDEGGVLKYDPAVVTLTNKVNSDNPVTLTAAAA